MSIIRAVFWGLLLWCLISMLSPDVIYGMLLMALGTITLISVCTLVAMFAFDWLDRNYRD